MDIISYAHSKHVRCHWGNELSLWRGDYTGDNLFGVSKTNRIYGAIVSVIMKHTILLLTMIKYRRMWNNYLVEMKLPNFTRKKLLSMITRPYGSGVNSTLRENLF
jgi:hypothetical protein